MVALKVEMFGGMAPAADTKYLPPNNASHATNCWLDSGILNGFYRLKHIATATALSKVGKVYRIPLDYESAYLFQQDVDCKYMFFENPDTDVIRGSVFGDVYDRYYWASSTSAPQYSTKERIFAEDAPWLLGVPFPTTAPTLSITGGSSSTIVETAYVVTFVSAYEEEGAPSPAVLGSGKADATWTLNAIPVPVAADMGVDRNITKKRIYRAVTSTAGVASFFQIIEIPAAQTSYTDTSINGGNITSNHILESTTWTPPPADLEGWCMGPNGIIVGWRNNELWCSEPYRPHAWPSTYVLTVEYPIVGVASIGTSIFVVTRGYPVVVTGSTPSSVIPVKVAMFEPCTSRGSIVTFQEGVYYASGNGLILLQSGVASNLTQSFITKEAWQVNVKGARFRAAKLGTSAYYGYGTVQFGVFQSDTFNNDAFQMEDHLGEVNGLFVTPYNPRTALILLESDVAVNNVQNDAWSSEMFVLKENKVYWLDLSDATQPTEPAIWHSKDYLAQWPGLFAAAKIFFDPLDTSPTLDVIRDTAQDQELSDNKYGIVRWYGDDRLLAVHEIRKSGELLRLPSDTKYDFFRFEVETRVDINSIHFASSSKDLRSA